MFVGNSELWTIGEYVFLGRMSMQIKEHKQVVLELKFHLSDKLLEEVNLRKDVLVWVAIFSVEIFT